MDTTATNAVVINKIYNVIFTFLLDARLIIAKYTRNNQSDFIRFKLNIGSYENRQETTPARIKRITGKVSSSYKNKIRFVFILL
jgi:hypothetical protein